MKKELEELTDEIRKLRKEVKELREAGGWFRIQHIPQPYPIFVPPQPYYPYPITPYIQPQITWGNAGNTTVAPRQDVTVYGGLHFT